MAVDVERKGLTAVCRTSERHQVNETPFLEGPPAMTDFHLSDIAADLGVTLREGGPLAGSRSGSRVLAVIRADRTPAVLKITTGTDGPIRDSAERELRVYLEMRQQLGIRLPELLDQRVTDHVIAILITAHPAPRPASTWTHRQWLTLADDLAQLHQTPVPAGHRWPRQSWLAASLRTPDVHAARAFWSRPGEPELLAPILADPEALYRPIDGTADCFLHGDCHTDNLLIEKQQLIWTDWQAAGVGKPAADLAFPVSRAVPDGAKVPQHDMIARYAAARGLDVTQLSRAVLAAELAVLIFTWPEYAAYQTGPGVQRIRDRLQVLAPRWLDG